MMDNSLKTIGLIGGMSWESTIPYYRQINESIRERLGGLHSAKILLYSLDFHEIEQLQHAGNWVPLLHIADPTADEIKRAGFKTVGLLGTRFTMEQGFYKDRLRVRHGLQVLTPNAQDRETIHRVIYEELCLGKVTTESRADYRRIMAELVRLGSEAIILGCTEISLLVSNQDSQVPLFDTTKIHARKAAEWAAAL
ncbi:MAG: amino acid racemase [Desulfobacterales bacterium]|nr:amino acid racemase [Desulfobacterales bacterium]